MFDKIYGVIQSIDDFVWGWGMIVLLLGTHIFMTVRTGFIQRKTITKGIPLSVAKEEGADGEVSPVRRPCDGAGVNHRYGKYHRVGTAIALGGPGAVLWCWLTGVFGMATKYAESLIAVKYRVKTADGRMQGGAMYALDRGLHMKWLGIIFAVFAGFASFGIGCADPGQRHRGSVQHEPWIDPWIIGVVVAVLTAFVIFGGIKSIASVCEKLVPFMALFYVIGCLIILGINYDYIIPAIQTICRLAFTKGAAAGGLVGGGIRLAIQYGVARGLFSNESGMGSARDRGCGGKDEEPGAPGAGVFNGNFLGYRRGLSDDRPCTGVNDHEESGHQCGSDHGRRGADHAGIRTDPVFRAVYPGGRDHHIRLLDDPRLGVLRGAVRGIFSGKWGLIPYKVLYIAVALIAPVLALDLVWKIADILNALMAIPNLIAVLLLSPVIVKETKKYVNDLDAVDDTPVPVVKTGIRGE